MGVLGRIASVAMVFAVSWGSIIYYWRSSGSMPSGWEMLAWLGLFPIGLSGAGYLVRRYAWQAAEKGASALSSGGADGAEVKSAARDDATGTSVVTPSAALLASAVRWGSAIEPSALLDRLQSPPRPPLETRWSGEGGMPLKICAAPDLDEYAVLPAQIEGFATRAAERRAAALLAPVLERLLNALVLAQPLPEAEEERVIAGLRRRGQPQAVQRACIDLLVPRDWSERVRAHVQAWALQQVTAAGLAVTSVEVQLVVVEGPLQVTQRVQRVVDRLSGGAGDASWHLIVAAASVIDATVIQGLQQAGRLHDGRQAGGCIPGEAAAGVLLASRSVTAPGAVRLWSPQWIEAAADDAARPAAWRRRVAAAAGAWWQASGLAAPALFLHDADGRAELALRAASVMQAIDPDLDASSQSLGLPGCLGDLGPALPLALMALAHDAVMTHDAPALLAVLDDDARGGFTALDPLPTSAPAEALPSAG